MAASAAVRSRLMLAAAKNKGNRPHAIPSLRLLTSPAWLMLERLRSPIVVRQKIAAEVGTSLAPAVETRLQGDV